MRATARPLAWLVRLLDGLISLVVAPTCAVCGTLLDNPTAGPVCATCWASIHRLTPPLCDACGDPVAACRASDAPVLLCPRCMSRSSPVGRARAIGDYAGTLRSIVHALKYGKHQSLAPRLADRMAASGRDVLDGADAVVPVPLHWVRKWRRGFNQADLLAERLDLPVWRALRRVRSTPSQVALGAPQRRANVRGAFALARRLPLKARSHRRIAIGPAARARFPASAWNRDAWSTRLEGKVVVLVDDVSTTGATLEACAKVLLAAGAREVRALTAARVVEGRKGQGDVNNIRNCSVTTE